MEKLVAGLEEAFTSSSAPEAQKIRDWIEQNRPSLVAAPDKIAFTGMVKEAASAGKLSKEAEKLILAKLEFRPAADAPAAAAGAEPKWERFKEVFTVTAGYLAPAVLALLAGVIIIAIFWLIRDYEFLRLLADVSTARGLITFVFTLGTMSIAVFLLVALFLAGQGNEESVGKRFDRSKEVLTTLIALLGTVVGFYFLIIPFTHPVMMTRYG